MCVCVLFVFVFVLTTFFLVAFIPELGIASTFYQDQDQGMMPIVLLVNCDWITSVSLTAYNIYICVCVCIQDSGGSPQS